ncbi:diadenylate cyclase, partial [bacterium]|nr:diadenylate cyclase [bacterium]
MLDNLLNIYKSLFENPQIMGVPAIFTLKDILQVLILIFIFFYVYIRFIRNTQSEKLVRGILFFIASAWVISAILIALDLKILGQIAQYLLTGILLSMVIVFQPELRKLLVHLGQTKFMTKSLFNIKNANEEAKINVIKEITEAVKYCSRVKRGALIVVQKTDDRMFYNEVGIELNAKVSAELILTIFFPNTPLHDGAMVIHGDKVLAAGVLLPLTEDPKLSWRYGTRHRAAIGAS